MRKKLLVELIHDLEQEMLKLGYTNNSMRFYRGRWRMLLEFAQKRGEKYFSEKLGIDFIEQHFHIFDKNFKTLSKSQMQELRVIQMLGDFQLHRVILTQYHKRKRSITKPYFIGISDELKSYCTNKGYSKCSIDRCISQSERFMGYLESQQVTNCKKINLESIHAYVKTLASYTHQTVEQHTSSIRIFFRFLFEKKKVKDDFSSKIPVIQARRQTHISSVWTEDELERLIAAIDRGNPKGKRDYAIILLACCLGIRCCDIRHLKIENFHWGDKKLVFTQSKTKNLLSLPLTQEVGWAVIDYLKYGRPKIDSPYLFVRHIAPFGPFSDNDHLHRLITRYMESAHISVLRKRRGMHSLRHTMASVLLEKNTPLSTITNILGHASINSTAVYLKVDIKKLKECPLSFGQTTDYE